MVGPYLYFEFTQETWHGVFLALRFLSHWHRCKRYFPPIPCSHFIGIQSYHCVSKFVDYLSEKFPNSSFCARHTLVPNSYLPCWLFLFCSLLTYEKASFSLNCMLFLLLRSSDTSTSRYIHLISLNKAITKINIFPVYLFCFLFLISHLHSSLPLANLSTCLYWYSWKERRDKSVDDTQPKKATKSQHCDLRPTTVTQ